MPAKPAWFHRLNQILEELRTLQTPLLDRHSMEVLFQVRERRGRQLMSDLPGVRIGNAMAVERLALIRKLEGVALSEECRTEANRKQRLSTNLAQVRKHLAARKVQLRAVADVHSRLVDALPGGIDLRPGELRIQFWGAEDLAAKLFELSQAMANDWTAFQKAAEAPVPCPSAV